jgi:hypothetical protein
LLYCPCAFHTYRIPFFPYNARPVRYAGLYRPSISPPCPYEAIRRDAGLNREAHDGKSFHALRRSVGKNMIVSGIGLIELAQILGQYNLTSTQEYIPLDSENLKSCALDFSGISGTEDDNHYRNNFALSFAGINQERRCI